MGFRIGPCRREAGIETEALGEGWSRDKATLTIYQQSAGQEDVDNPENGTDNTPVSTSVGLPQGCLGLGGLPEHVESTPLFSLPATESCGSGGGTGSDVTHPLAEFLREI
jgi:hypothetical protein